MRLILTFVLLTLAGCARLGAPAASAPAPLQQWLALQVEVLGIIGEGAPCGPVSVQIGFCRSDGREVPAPVDAALSDACRGQPLGYLATFGTTPAHWNDRRAIAAALRGLFASEPFGSREDAHTDYRALLKLLHDRDQALRFFRPDVQAANPAIIENSRWVAICAHALLSKDVVSRFLAGATPQALAADEELANYAWLLVQHSDFDPQYQLTMSRWFGLSDAPFMQHHSAFLYDRAMVGLHRTQRFGTQLRCNAGVREPFPVEDPAGMDTRRIALGLAPMREHLATFPRPCPRPQPG